MSFEARPLRAISVFLAVVLVFFAIHEAGIADEKFTVLRVGLLIDGSGREPVEDAIIVIKGKRIQAVGKESEIQLPQGSQVIHFRNKTAVPGLVDAHAHYREWQGEIYLSHGVTSAFDVGDNPLSWRLAQKEGIDKGKILGPRLLTAGRMNRPAALDTGEGGTRGRTEIYVKDPVQAGVEVERLAASGVDIIKALEDLTVDDLRVMSEAALKTGKRVVAHSINGTEAVLAGVGIHSIEHSHSVALATVTSPEGRKKLHEARTRRSNRMTTQEVHSFMEEDTYEQIIQALVSKNVCWTPTLATTWRAFSPQRGRFQTRELKLFSLPGLRYLPPYFRENTQEYFLGTTHLDSELLERSQAGYRKLQDFIRGFVKAGGRLQTGSDPNSVLPGLAIHREIELLVEAGLTPFEALMAATRNPSECAGRGDDFGMITPGRFADIVILDANPLQDISAIERIHMVFKEGQPRRPGYRSDYRNPIPRPAPDRPAPEIEELTPESVTQGDGPILLAIKGKNFLGTAVVKLNGKPLPSKVKFRPSRFPQNFRRGTEIEATIPPELLHRAGTYPVVVEHPGTGGALSNTIYLVVKFR